MNSETFLFHFREKEKLTIQIRREPEISGPMCFSSKPELRNKYSILNNTNFELNLTFLSKIKCNFLIGCFQILK